MEKYTNTVPSAEFLSSLPLRKRAKYLKLSANDHGSMRNIAEATLPFEQPRLQNIDTNSVEVLVAQKEEEKKDEKQPQVPNIDTNSVEVLVAQQEEEKKNEKQPQLPNIETNSVEVLVSQQEEEEKKHEKQPQLQNIKTISGEVVSQQEEEKKHEKQPAPNVMKLRPRKPLIKSKKKPYKLKSRKNAKRKAIVMEEPSDSSPSIDIYTDEEEDKPLRKKTRSLTEIYEATKSEASYDYPK